MEADATVNRELSCLKNLFNMATMDTVMSGYSKLVPEIEDVSKPLTRLAPEPGGRVRATSIAAFRAVEDSGLVGDRQKEIYRIVYHHGPLTSGEAFRILERQQGHLRFDSNTRARFTELRTLGLLREVGRRKDDLTGHLAILWDVTDLLPARVERRATLRQRHTEALKLIDELKERLRSHGEIIT